LLRKLLSNVQTVLEQYNNISRHLIGAAKKLNALSANARESLAKESIFIDPWSSVRHLQIKWGHF
jgi:ABC-type transporter Mla subunit MlaD